MKLNRTLLTITALLGVAIATSFAGDPPAKVKAEKTTAKQTTANPAEVIPGAEAKPATYFYTGKPYDEDLGGYVFNYRIYSPGMNRWTTSDPSGFPDGANNQIYAPTPTNEFDSLGLLSAATWGNEIVSFNGLEYKKGTAKIEKGQFKDQTIEVLQLWTQVAPPTDPSFNCFAFAFGHTDFWIRLPADAQKVLISEHKKITQPMVGSIGIYRLAANDILAHATVVSAMDGNNVKWVDQKDGNLQIELNFEVGNVRYPTPIHKAVEYWE